MFHRGWFLIDVLDEQLGAELTRIVKHYGVVRVRAFDEGSLALLREPGRVAGVIAEISRERYLGLERIRDNAPLLPVLGLMREMDAGLINLLQARGVETAMLPVQTPNLVGFVQRALASCFLPHDRVSRLVAHLAHTCKLTAREVQLLTFCLGNEPRARVRRRLGIEENTLKSQIKALLRKCNERSVDGLAKNVLRAALLFDESAPSVAPLAPWLPAAAPLARASGA